MIKVGITGGIGSGKTSFCKVWEELGAYVLYADDFVKQLMNEDEDLKSKIKETFGEESYLETGELNRTYLADEAFQKGRVQELNALVHPVLWERTAELADELEKDGVEVFAEEAAILLQNGRPEGLDFVILIMAEQDKRVRRVTSRDEALEDEVLARMQKQPDFGDLAHLCDFVVLNDGSLRELRDKAQELYNKIKQID